MSVKVREKRGKLYLDIYQSGKRTWEALHLELTRDKAQNKEIWRLAEICRSKRETQILTGAWNVNDPVSGKTPLIAFLEGLSKNYKKPGVVTTCVNHIKNFHGGGISLERVTAKWVEDFQNYMLKKEGVSQSTAGYYSRILRSALRKAARNNMIVKNPADEIKNIPIPETELAYLSFDELKRLAAVAVDDPYGSEVRRAFLFACFTGLRVVDLESLAWGGIETNPMQIVKSQVKTKQPVYIPLSETARSLIGDGKGRQPDELVFNLWTHNRRTSYIYLGKWAKEAGIAKPMGWHTARRTFAVMSLEAGADLYTVSKLLGHTNIKTTQVYAKVTDKLKRAAEAALPKIEIGGL